MKNCKPIQTSLVNQKLTKNMHEEKERCDCDEKYSVQGALGSLIYINCK